MKTEVIPKSLVKERKMKFEELKKRIIAQAEEQASLLVTGNSISQEARRIKKSFKLSGIWSTLFIIFRHAYPPNMFPAVGVLLDSYPPELSACMLAFHFRGQLRGNLMMFLEEIEKVEALRQRFIGHRKESRIDQAAEVIARCLCLMDFLRLAQSTFQGMVSPSLREKVKTKLFELDQELALLLTQ